MKGWLPPTPFCQVCYIARLDTSQLRFHIVQISATAFQWPRDSRVVFSSDHVARALCTRAQFPSMVLIFHHSTLQPGHHLVCFCQPRSRPRFQTFICTPSCCVIILLKLHYKSMNLYWYLVYAVRQKS